MKTCWIEAEWPLPPKVMAVTTLRCGGVSREAYASLNMAAHVGDDPACVSENRSLVQKWLELPAEPVWLNQVHGGRIMDAAKPDTEGADGSYSREKGIVCAVMTADCLPVLLCGDGGECIAAVHGGWRGLLEGVIENAMAAMGGVQVTAWMGPAIGPKAFQVGDEVRESFLARSCEFAPAFSAQGNGKWLADIYRAGRIILASLGVREIYGGHFCTFTEKDRFFSYRRDGVTGRMASLIWREE
ncbi:MAG: peptidoglycan editing factor PgeF [Gammaproteobacteria bacterium]